MTDTLRRFFDSDVWWSFTRSPITIISAIVALICILGAVFAPWIAPHNPFDLASLNLLDAFKPPAWTEEGEGAYPLGTDDQGRDVLSAIMYGARVSLLVGLSATLFATTLGVTLGLLAGYLGGKLDALEDMLAGTLGQGRTAVKGAPTACLITRQHAGGGVRPQSRRRSLTPQGSDSS